MDGFILKSTFETTKLMTKLVNLIVTYEPAATVMQIPIANKLSLKIDGPIDRQKVAL